MMGKLGFDIKLSDMSESEVTYANAAVKNYNRLKPTILDGDMYRLVSPYEGAHASTMFVGKDKQQAVVFAFDVYPRFGDKRYPVCLMGLDPAKQYRVKEINLMPGQRSWMDGNDRVYSGDYLMTVGLNIFTGNKLHSRVIEVTAE